MEQEHDYAELPELSAALIERIRRVRLVVFDVDGTLTDGGINFSEGGGEVKHFHVQDGAGLKFLMQAGLQIAFITNRKSKLVEIRAAELGLQHVVQGAQGKGLELERLQARLQIAQDETAAMGDDLPDLALFSRSGLTLAPSDAVPEILTAADWIAGRRGGHGAARQAAELILKIQGKWDQIVASFAGE